MTRHAAVFAALGDDTRLRIVARLCKDGPLSIVQLTRGTDVSRQAVTKHLHALSNAGLVKSQSSGRERIWRLQTKQLEHARIYLNQISRQWDDAIARLRAFAEQE